MGTPVSAPEADRQASFMPARHPATDRTATGARAPTGGGAGALRGAFSEHALRTPFAAGPNTAAGAAGVTATVAGALVVALVRTPRATGVAVTKSDRETLTEKTGAPRGQGR